MDSYRNEKDEISFSAYNTNDEYLSEFGNVNESAISPSCSNALYPVNKLSEKYRHIFSSFEYFNKVQTKAINTILYTNKSVIVSSPTESGKTVIFELAIIHFLETIEKSLNDLENSKIIYVTPIKTLCSERHESWKNKFSSYGLKCVEITSDTEFSDDLYLLTNHHLIITTPEKWDSLTRKYKELKYQLLMVKLFLIDEVHLINEGIRGATLETVVSRMKMIPKTTKLDDLKLRFVATCATVSNIEDIAKWLSSDQNHSTHYFKSNEDERPVKLQKIVLGYNYWPNNFKFDLDLTYKLKPLIKQYSNGRPTIIFCPTRKSVESTYRILVKEITITLCNDKQLCINENLKEINNNKIKEFVKLGIGCHHAGMSIKERNSLENLFRIGCLYILIATSTLAMGVNLSAHLVIIKSTEHYKFNGYREYNECQVLQMIGRAGRPQYDTTATAIIMTKNSMKGRYEEILFGNQIVESNLHKNLIEHLNAEIFLGTINDITVAMDWIRSTFMYVRACKVPQKYLMIKTLNIDEIEYTLQNLCLAEIKSLELNGLINYSNNKITSKPEGEIMAKYSIIYGTMKSFMHLKGTESLSDMIRLLSYSKEFESIKLKNTEIEKLNILNKNILPDADVIRYPIEEGINTREAKINCLIQATLGTLQIMDNSLTQDASKIIFIAIRLAKAIREIAYRKMQFNISRIACILVKCLTTRLWEQSKFISKLIPKIGFVLSRQFVLNGKTTLQSIIDSDPRDLERFLNRQPPFGNRIQDFIRQIPKYELQVYFDEHLELILIKIILKNRKNITKNIQLHTVSILVGDSDNNLLKVQQIRNEEFSEQGVKNISISLRNQILLDKPNYAVTVCLISDQWVGNDVEVKFKPCNHEEHVNNELMSEYHCTTTSPLETFLSPQSIKKKKTIKESINQKKEKTQINIEKYLQNVSSKDQDPKVINKLHVEEDKNIDIKYDTNECNAATHKFTCNVIEAKTNSLNNRYANEYIKFDEDNLNKYLSYDELANDDVFHDLFVPDDNFHVISKAFDSAIEKSCLRENVIQREVIDPITKNCVVKSDRITPEYVNQYRRNYFSQLEDKENINPFKSEQVRFTFTQQQEIMNQQFTQEPSTPLTNKLSVKRSYLTDYYGSKSIKSNRSPFPSRTLTCNRSDNDVNDLNSDTTSLLSEANIPVKNLKAINQPTAIGRLSIRIETNLKATTDFYVPLSEGIQSEVTTNDCYEENTPISMGSKQTRSDGFLVSTPIRTTCTRRSGKTLLDKYFKAVKTSRRLQGPNVDKFIATKTALNNLTINSVDCGRRSLSVPQIYGERTTNQKTTLENEKLFDSHISTYHKVDSKKSPAINTARQALHYYPAWTEFKNDL